MWINIWMKFVNSFFPPSNWCQPGFVYLLAGEQLGWEKWRQSRGLGLILSATVRVWSRREPANCRPAASHAGRQPLVPWAAFQLSAPARHTQPPTSGTEPTCDGVCVWVIERQRSREWKVWNIMCAVLGDFAVFKRWKEFLCKWAIAFQLNVFAQADWWKKKY